MVDQELDELRREFLAEAAAKVREIQEAVDATRSPETLERVTYLAHQLKGSGGSYGFKRISSVAADLEKTAEKLGGSDGEGLDAKLREYAGSLRMEIEDRARELGS